MSEKSFAPALGWFGIALGLAEIAAPRELGEFVALGDDPNVLRALGAREVASGIGIFVQRRPVGWLWARVGGDAIDLAFLGLALRKAEGDRRNRVLGAVAAVAGVAILDLVCTLQVGAAAAAAAAATRTFRSTTTVTIDRSPAELYAFWRDFQNLPRFMRAVASVKALGNGRSHWVAKLPNGTKIEWDAELTDDRPDEAIAWRSTGRSKLRTAGNVRFIPAPAGRGTIVRLEMQYTPPGGRIGAAIAKLFSEVPELEVAHELRRFKQLMETGEIATIEGQPSGRDRIQELKARAAR